MGTADFFPRSRSFKTVKFVYVSQLCALFVFRHANLRTTGIRKAAAHSVAILQRPCYNHGF
jgi:hypothetical protein